MHLAYFAATRIGREYLRAEALYCLSGKQYGLLSLLYVEHNKTRIYDSRKE